MNPRLETLLTAETLRHGNAIDALADQAVQRCAREFKAKFPKRKLTIIFGMGSEFIRIDDDQLQVYWSPASRSVVWEPGTCEGKIIPAAWLCEWKHCKIQPGIVSMVLTMLDDVIEITDGYTRGCPESIR